MSLAFKNNLVLPVICKDSELLPATNILCSAPDPNAPVIFISGLALGLETLIPVEVVSNFLL